MLADTWAGLGAVFPTQVGVNRFVPVIVPTTSSIPHAGGGEPGFERFRSLVASVFPTQVGVNRPLPPLVLFPTRIPHAGGGEPG